MTALSDGHSELRGRLAGLGATLARAAERAVDGSETGRARGSALVWAGECIRDFLEAQADPDPPSTGDLLERVLAGALTATRAARRNPENEVAEAVRRGWWRATFLLAEALGLDAFGRRPTALPVAGGIVWPERPPREPRPYTGASCAGVRKDGQACGCAPSRGSHFCRHHQEQVAGREPEPVDQGEGEDLDARLAAWLESVRPLSAVVGGATR